VLLPNYRGSVGRGREFQQAILGDWGGREQEDIAAGGRWLGDREFVDEDRLAVFGGSYGGYSAYCQLTMHPEIWQTGVAWIGITDLQLLYEESMPHFKATLEQQLGDPEENADLWRERSPITHVENMEAPVFVVHGVNDPRCPISQARTFRDALLDEGWEMGPDGDFEYEELEEEGHGSSDAEQKVRAFGLIGEYLNRRL
jgi:dipeptidyl aminopeptidase/acylaminoacyl peptidase